ncbi:hypothetical protein PoB_002715700 [Plakobranchus ocellatus]|uniref:Uncharacterized protein n=1 Tax=Plakobranchus ocellatus TaxID=259542 RepID=A0AAV4A043_9GAST|nr:hypothetical protein PoB_002715700 [Plakobranchus ocellatus]
MVLPSAFSPIKSFLIECRISRTFLDLRGARKSEISKDVNEVLFTMQKPSGSISVTGADYVREPFSTITLGKIRLAGFSDRERRLSSGEPSVNNDDG